MAARCAPLARRAILTNMGKQRELRQRWQRIAKLILAKENVLTVSRALELALFHGCQARRVESPGRMKAPALTEAFKGGQ